MSERKESDMKEQNRQNEELRFEVERMQLQLQKVSHEREQTQELRKTDNNAIEGFQ